MAELTQDQEVKTAIEAAEAFVTSYYPALNRLSGLKDLSTFYVKNDPSSPLKPDISLNGNLITDTTELETVFERQPAKTHYEVLSFDCHTLNSNYNVGAPNDLLEMNKLGKKMSILVMVSGSVRYGEGGETKGFTDNVVLVPNWELFGKSPKNNLKKKWLVQTQKLRVVF
ncbi:hypothetical protein G7Y89_g11550 [Cudoniella acicularis]|uniref:NTF2 domain-containing protein n=1 Tax=Cudoniella acicularis TaxID=354080 RepID=A0A8H4RAQ4_9HELO|nr:hypothetical protein G7Y89_g11550 [Cudoniella acicularis]